MIPTPFARIRSAAGALFVGSLLAVPVLKAQVFEPSWQSLGQYRVPAWREGFDPRDLYTPPHSLSDSPDSEYCTRWYLRTTELIDKYHPDLLCFDGPMPIVCPCEGCGRIRPLLEGYGLRAAAHFYNANQSRLSTRDAQAGIEHGLTCA